MARSRLRRRWLFYQHYRKRRFNEALAQLPAQSWPESSQELIACSRLGLHKTVAQNQWDGKHLESGMATAVSLAHCGEGDSAAELVQHIRPRLSNRRSMVQLATSLAPVLPAVALDLVDHEHAPLPLRAALLLRNSQAAAAIQLLQKVNDKLKQKSPELALMTTNALGGDPSQQLKRINTYLNSKQLPSVALRSNSEPPGPTNLTAISRSPAPASKTPLVTVLMTAYNAHDRIAFAIEGLLNQSWQNLEVVVVDDASTDDTASIIQDYARSDARVRCVQIEQNSGTYVAKTAGLGIAKGEFVTCHDADDWSHPNRIETQMRPLLSDPQLIATTSKWVRMQDDGSFYARPVYPLTRLNPASPLFRRRPVEQGPGLWDLVRTGADSEFLARLRLYFGHSAVKGLPFPLTFGSHRSDSLMTAPDTGYNAKGISPTRLDYWESWTHWHIAELRAGRKPILQSAKNTI